MADSAAVEDCLSLASADDSTGDDSNPVSPRPTGGGAMEVDTAVPREECRCLGKAGNVLNKTFLDIMYLSLFAVGGCALRIRLAKTFSTSDSSLGSFVLDTHTSLFADLFSNMLGSWIIGFVATGASLRVGKVPWAAFPHSSKQQENFSLQLGIRTGFCGSLTTYATWNLNMVQLLMGPIDGFEGMHLWQRMLFGYLIGIQLPVISCEVGESMAFHAWLLFHRLDAASVEEHKHVVDQIEIAARTNSLAAIAYMDRASSSAATPSAISAGFTPDADFAAEARTGGIFDPELQIVGGGVQGNGGRLTLTSRDFSEEMDLDRCGGGALSPLAPETFNRVSSRASELETVVHCMGDGADLPPSVGSDARASIPLRSGSETATHAHARTSAPATQTSAATTARAANATDQSDNRFSAALPYGLVTIKASEYVEDLVKAQRSAGTGLLPTHIFFIGLSVGVYALVTTWFTMNPWAGTPSDCCGRNLFAAPPAECIVAHTNANGTQAQAQAQAQTHMLSPGCDRADMLAMMLAPAGALLRWRLSKLNGTFRGWWSFFFLGTFLANALACTIDGALSAVLARQFSLHGDDAEWLEGNAYWLYVCLHAVMTGFAGCLSTISTFVTEILKITPTKNQSKLHALTYISFTWVACFSLTMITYAWTQSPAYKGAAWMFGFFGDVLLVADYDYDSREASQPPVVHYLEMPNAPLLDPCSCRP